jgi:hypothetical protein
VRLLIHHPNLPSCETCQKYLVDYSWIDGTGTGEVRKWQSGPNEWKPLERKADNPAPCKSCPKKGPEHEREFILTEASVRALHFYQETKATFGKGLSEEAANDSVVRQNFSILDQLFDRVEKSRDAEAFAVAMESVIARNKR